MKIATALPALALVSACAAGPWSDAECDVADVVPIDWSSFDRPLPADENAFRMRAILANSNRYALTTWYTERGFADDDGAYLDLGGTDEHDIRSVASEAFALAVSLRLGVYDEAVTGVARADAEEITLRLIGSIAASHRSNDPEGWGGGWQTALWTTYAGTAGWLLWDELSPGDAGNVARMVQSEAQRLVGYRVPYFRDAHGSVQSSGDSKAEENAWNAQVLFLAVNMMPEHPQVPAWEYKAAELAVSAFARPADLAAARWISGRSLSQWLRGSNANADGTVINHDIVHPDYIATAAYTVAAPLWYGLRRQPTPDAMFAGSAAAYASLSELVWNAQSTYEGTSCVTGSCNCDISLRCDADDPGGTIYVPDSDEIYFPHGTDWGRGRRMNFAMFDALADAFQLDTNMAIGAAHWEALHAQAVLDAQLRSDDRRAYVRDDEDVYESREEWVAAYAALAWFSKYVSAQEVYARTDRFVGVVIDDRDHELSVDGDWESVTPGGQLGLESRRTSASAARDGASARWQPRLPAGTYTVRAWWSRDPELTTRATFRIAHNRGVADIEVDQRHEGGEWVALGTHAFDGSDASGVVTLSSSDADGALVADAVWFERVEW